MKIKIHDFTYIFLLISFLSGYFEYIFLLLIIIFIHESGHYIFSKIMKLNNQYIVIYPFGGITIIKEDLNIPIYKEFIILIGGLIFQLLFYLLVLFLYDKGFVTYHVFSIIEKINFYLLSFNFLPILPLDGGKLLNILTDIFFNYRLSNKISIIVSILFIILFGFTNSTLFAFILCMFLIKCIYIEIMNLNIKYNVFLFERYKNNYIFNKYKYINNVYKFKRDYYHIINNTSETVFLRKMFDRTSELC